MEKTIRHKRKFKKSSAKSKTSANKTGKKTTCNGPTCSMYLADLSKKLAQKKGETDESPLSNVHSIIQSVTNTLPTKFSGKSAPKTESPKELNVLQEIASELIPSDTIKIPVTIVKKKEKENINSQLLQPLQPQQTTQSLQSHTPLQHQAMIEQKSQQSAQQQSLHTLQLQQSLQSQQTLQSLQHKPTQQKKSKQSTQQQQKLQLLEVQERRKSVQKQLSHQLKPQQSSQEQQPVELQQSLQSHITQRSLQSKHTPLSLQHQPTHESQSQQQKLLHPLKLQQQTQLLRQKSTLQRKPQQPKYKQKSQQQMQKQQSQSQGFIMPKMPLVSSDVLKIEKRIVIKTDVAINTGNDEDVAKELIQHVDTLRKISLISEEFNKKTAMNLKEIIHSVQDDLVRKLKEMQEEQNIVEQNGQEKLSIPE